jgi:hypothetical protein
MQFSNLELNQRTPSPNKESLQFALEQQTARTMRKTKAKQQQKLQLKLHQNRAMFEHSNVLLKLQHACSCSFACHHSSQDSIPAI